MIIAIPRHPNKKILELHQRQNGPQITRPMINDEIVHGCFHPKSEETEYECPFRLDSWAGPPPPSRKLYRVWLVVRSVMKNAFYNRPQPRFYAPQVEQSFESVSSVVGRYGTWE